MTPQQIAGRIAGEAELEVMAFRSQDPEALDRLNAAMVKLRDDIAHELSKPKIYCDVCGCSCPCCRDLPTRAMIEIARQKCRQYWNERAVGDAEFHAIMGFIHDALDNQKSRTLPMPPSDLPDLPPAVPQFDGDQTKKECYEDGWAACFEFAQKAGLIP